MTIIKNGGCQKLLFGLLSFEAKILKNCVSLLLIFCIIIITCYLFIINLHAIFLQNIIKVRTVLPRSSAYFFVFLLSLSRDVCKLIVN